MNSKTQNIQWINNLRVLATLSVIILHVCSSNLNTNIDYKWLTNDFIDSSVRFCVPVFIMITGTLMIPKQIELKVYLTSRFSRIVFPLIFWTIVYSIYQLYTSEMHYNNLAIVKLIYANFQYGASYHFWYVYMIIGIFLIIPVISPWANNANKNELLFFIFIWLVTLIFETPLINKYAININLIYFSKYIGYLLLGFYLSKLNLETFTKLKLTLILLYSTCLLFTFYATYYYSLKEGVFMGHFYNYLSLNIVVMSTIVFLFLRLIAITNKNFILIINLINKYSFGIYFVHILILNAIINPLFTIFADFPLIEIVIKSTFCFSLSFLIILLIDKIPLLKKMAY